jgi:DNA mismatch repair protein MutS
MGIVGEYLQITERYRSDYGPKTIVLMQVGSFFEVYGLLEEDGSHSGSAITEFSRINDMVIATKTNTTHAGKQVVMAGFGLTSLEKNVKKLQDASYTIVVYEQDIQGKNTSRSLVEIISPGTYFGNDHAVLSNTTMCVWVHDTPSTRITKAVTVVGVASVDIHTGRVCMAQFSADSFHGPSTYDELERLVTVHQPSECVMVSNLGAAATADVIGFAGLHRAKVHCIDTSVDTALGAKARNATKQVYQDEVFRRFYGDQDNLFVSLAPDHDVAVQALTLLLDFVHGHSPYLVANVKTPEIERCSTRLLLANHSLTQLNITDDRRHTGKLRSVASLLNECVTAMGKRRFGALLCNPTSDASRLSRAYDVTEHLLEGGSWERHRIALGGVADLEKLVRKVVMKRATPRDIASLAEGLRVGADLYGQVQNDGPMAAYVSDERDTVECVSERARRVINRLASAFDLEACAHIDEMSVERLSLSQASDSFIRSGVDAEVDAARRAGLNGRNVLEAIRCFLCDNLGDDKSRTRELVKLHETAKQVSTLQLTQRRSLLLTASLDRLRTGGSGDTVPLQVEGRDGTVSFLFDLSAIRIVPCGNSKTMRCVTSPQIEEVCRGLHATRDQLVQRYIHYYRTFLDAFQTDIPDIERVTDFVTLVDVEQCKCYVARKFNYCKPDVRPHAKSYVAASGIRHPLIEHLQTKETYVPNDMSLGGDVNGVLLYGTNAVGKTSIIKAIGIAVVMAQAGLYVPCERFEYAPYTRVFTRILGDDNLFKGLSTFAVEMSELRSILTQADERSLVLGDELCSGTESDSALSIFTAGVETLHQRGCSFVFATHFHQVSRYPEIRALDRLAIMHMSVVYDGSAGCLVYDRKLKKGAGESMYGLEVCKSLRLPDEFLARAHEIRRKHSTVDESVLERSQSRYNAKKLAGGVCEMCGSERTAEIHHIAHQKEARADNQYITGFHKNHPGNLVCVCDACHTKFHESGDSHRRVRTSEGYVVLPNGAPEDR